jgi:hypothetical protein
MTGIIIFGTKGVERTVDTGVFHCPNCRTEAQYTQRKITRFFTLYFIPVIPLGSLGELVRCDRCGSDYSTEVLRLGRHDVQQATVPWRCAVCNNVNPAEYTDCVSCGRSRS